MLQEGIRDSSGPCLGGTQGWGLENGILLVLELFAGDLGQERSLFSLPQFPLLNSANDTSYLPGIVRI